MGPLGSELKFLVDHDAAVRIREWARAQLAPDPFGGGPHGDEYQTTTLYFDTAGFDVFHRRGSYGRSKYRIRRYGADGALFVERKLRSRDRLAKRRSRVTLGELGRLAHVNGTAIAAATAAAWPGGWFERRLAARHLRPVCQVAYVRTARIHLPSGTRLTIDEELCTQTAGTPRFAPPDGRPFLERRAIVELKFQDALPAAFRAFVEEFRLDPQRASKYRLAVGALELVGAAPHA